MRCTSANTASAQAVFSLARSRRSAARSARAPAARVRSTPAVSSAAASPRLKAQSIGVRKSGITAPRRTSRLHLPAGWPGPARRCTGVARSRSCRRRTTQACRRRRARCAGTPAPTARDSTLTGFKIKSKQIVRLRAQGIAFHVNASGHPVVTRAAVEGHREAAAAQDGWPPGLIGA